LKKIILVFSSALLIALLLQWGLIFFSPFDIPEYIPNTPINILGLLLLVTLLITLIFLNKKILQRDQSVSIGRLTLIGTFVCFLSETAFQLIRQPTLQATGIERFGFILEGIINVTILAAIMSFFIAFQMKTKRTGLLLLFIVLFLVLFQVAKPFLVELNLVQK
jgi:hypothetical protein